MVNDGGVCTINEDVTWYIGEEWTHFYNEDDTINSIYRTNQIISIHDNRIKEDEL